MNQPLIPSQGSGKPTEASPRSHPAERAELRLRTRAILYGILAAAILSGLIALGSRGFHWFDATLIGYAVASIFAAMSKSAETRRVTPAGVQRQPVANPDDPPVQHPPQGPHGPLPGPNYLGLAGRTAIVQGQVFLVAVILIAQLWLITDALYELLSGRAGLLFWLALASGIGFAFALIITFWPRRRIEEP